MIDMCFFTGESQEGEVVRGRAPMDQPMYAKIMKDPRFKYVEEQATESMPAKMSVDFAAVNTEYVRRGGLLTDNDVVLESERPFVSGFMDPRLAEVFHAIVNLDTDLMCVFDGDKGKYDKLPLTYTFYNHQHMLLHGKRYPLQGRPSIGTALFMDFMRADLDPAAFTEDFSSLSCVEVIDMKHGRRAKGHLYPLVISCLRKAHSALNAVGVKIVSPP
jgi:hypothetical protein